MYSPDIYIDSLGSVFFLFSPRLHQAQEAGIMDSLAVWKEKNDFKSICAAADALLKQHIQLTPCDERVLFNSASKAAIDLFEPSKSLEYALHAGRPKNKCRDSAVLMESRLRAGVAYNLLGKLDSAVALTEEVILYGKKNSNKDLLISALTNMGMMLNKNGAFKEAKAAFEDGMKILGTNAAPRPRATGYLNIALCHLNLKEYDHGLILIDSALLFAKQANVPPLIAHAYGLKSALFRAQGDLTQWLATVDTAILISRQQGNLNQAAFGMQDKLEYFVSSNEFPKAQRIGLEILSILEGGDQYMILNKTYKALYKTYRGLNKLPEAILYLEKHMTLKDTLANQSFRKQIHELDLKYHVAEKDNRLLLQNIEINKARAVRQRLIALVFLLALLVFFYLWRNKTHRKMLAKLFYKERELEKEMRWLRKLYPTSSPDSIQPSEEAAENVLQQLILKAQTLVVQEQLYLNPDLNMNDLVQRLGTNRKYLSLAINEYSAGGFRLFINKYRIEKAKGILWEIALGTTPIQMGEIWKHVGFNSNQTLYRIFKLLTDLTPKEYLEQVELEQTGKAVLHKNNEEEQ